MTLPGIQVEIGILRTFAQIEVQRIDWGTFREAGGAPHLLGRSLENLLASKTPEEAEKRYWELENHVVVQGQLFSSAMPVISVILASLCDERPRYVRISLLELLFQIVSGEAHESEVSSGRPDLGEECRELARTGLWLLYRELKHGESEAARDVIERIEPDLGRLTAYT